MGYEATRALPNTCNVCLKFGIVPRMVHHFKGYVFILAIDNIINITRKCSWVDDWKLRAYTHPLIFP